MLGEVPTDPGSSPPAASPGKPAANFNLGCGEV